MKKDDILEILEEFDKSNVNELKIKREDIELEMNKKSPGNPREKEEEVEELPKPSPKVAKADEVEDKNNYIVESPIVATFYSQSSPDEPAFIQVGDYVEKDQVLFILEAMKMFNEIKSPVAGKVVNIFPEDGDLVEYGQKIVEIDVD